MTRWILQDAFNERTNERVEIKRDAATGIVTLESHTLNGAPHRVDGPAFVVRNPDDGTVLMEQYSLHGKLHRIDAPALIHRDASNGPVTIEQFWLNDFPHRADGPALIARDPNCGHVIRAEYWVHGVKVTRKQFETEWSPHKDLLSMLRQAGLGAK